jgi:cytochrome c oxidase cbb3-type subunit 3
MNSNEPQDTILGHGSESDGIEEYDNRLPSWWVGLFYATIAIGVWVFVDWHIVTPRSLAGEYDTEVAAALAAMPPAAKPVAVVVDAGHIAAGKDVFSKNCVSCHGEKAEGKIGPDLTDATWIHGGKPEEIGNTVFYGVPAKGMLSWGPILGPQAVADVSAYIHSLGGGQ